MCERLSMEVHQSQCQSPRLSQVRKGLSALASHWILRVKGEVCARALASYKCLYTLSAQICIETARFEKTC